MGGDDRLDLGLEVLGHDTLGNLGEERLLLGLEVLLEVSVPLDDVLDGDRVEETVDTGVDERDHDLSRDGLVLALLEELSETRSTREEETGRGVEVGSELAVGVEGKSPGIRRGPSFSKRARTNLREGGDLTELSEVELEGTSDGLHDLGLGGRSDTRDGKSDVDSRANTLEEELGLEEDLSVGDGDDVGAGGLEEERKKEK